MIWVDPTAPPGGHCYHSQARSYLLFPQSLLVLGGLEMQPWVQRAFAHGILWPGSQHWPPCHEVSYYTMKYILMCLSLLPCAAYCWAPGPSAVLVHEGGSVSLSREGPTTWSSAPGLMVGGWAGQARENLRLRAVQTPSAWATEDSVG